jgi:hypothetical protein
MPRNRWRRFVAAAHRAGAAPPGASAIFAGLVLDQTEARHIVGRRLADLSTVPTCRRPRPAHRGPLPGRAGLACVNREPTASQQNRSVVSIVSGLRAPNSLLP